mgnify:CR=1 FL=1
MLGYSPSPGRERVVSPEAIQMKLSSGAFAKDIFRILGKSCLVRVATQSIGGRELAARVAELAKPHLSQDAKLEVRGEPNEWVLPIPRGEVAPPEIQITNNPASIRGDGSIDVRAMSGGECLGTTSVAVRVRLEAEVLVASAGLLKGDAADTGGFERKRVDITSVAGDAIRDAVVLKGRILARPIAKDAVLTSGDLAQAPIFRKGDQTRIVVRRGALRIEALVRVEADAILGAQVPVTCLEFGKTLVARVCEDGTLSIDTSGKSKE